MATTAKQKVNFSWGPLPLGLVLDLGWYDIILLTGEQYNEVYAEHGYFHFSGSQRRDSIPQEKVEWVRVHSKQ